MATDPYDKKDQSIREAKAFAMSLINDGHLQTLANAYEDEEYMDHARRNGLVNDDNELLCFYTQLPATELEHMMAKGDGGRLIKENCIPVITDFNPKRGYRNEPNIKIKRLITRKEGKRHNVDLKDTLHRWQLWKGNENLQDNRFHLIEETVLTSQLELAKLMDNLGEKVCSIIGINDPSKPRTKNYEKKLRNRTLK